MRLDHLLSKENRDLPKKRRYSKLQFRFKKDSEGHAVETLVIALFNFEGTGRNGNLKEKDQPEALKNMGV